MDAGPPTPRTGPARPIGAPPVYRKFHHELHIYIFMYVYINLRISLRGLVSVFNNVGTSIIVLWRNVSMMRNNHKCKYLKIG